MNIETHAPGFRMIVTNANPQETAAAQNEMARSMAEDLVRAGADLGGERAVVARLAVRRYSYDAIDALSGQWSAPRFDRTGGIADKA